MKLMQEKDLQSELKIDARMQALDGRYDFAPACTNLDDPGRRLGTAHTKKMLTKLAGVEPAYDPEYAKKLAMMNWVGDPLSDKAVLSIRRGGRNPHEITAKFLEGGIDAVENPPEELVQIWKQVSEDPEWLDWEKLERGAKVFRRFGVFAYQFAGTISIDGYRSPNISRTLMSTGQYSDQTAFKRFLLTCNFWLQVSEEGGMRLHGEGWKVALRIRLLHTLIRRAVYGSDRWDEKELGMPISQLGLLAAPMLGSPGMGLFTRALGYRTTDAEIEDMNHFWRYVTYIMGYQEICKFPETIEDSVKALFHLSCISVKTDDDDGIRLGQSYIDSFTPPEDLRGWVKVKRWAEHKVNIAHLMMFVPPESRTLLKVPNSKFWTLVYFLGHAPKTFIQDTRRKRSKSYADKLDRRMTQQRRTWVKRQLGEADLVYRPQSKF